MANNKTEIVGIPLNGKLNMNKNQELIDPTNKMFNDVNAPIYGGNLSNLYTASIGNGYRSIFDKHANRYQPTNVSPAGIKMEKYGTGDDSERILNYEGHFVLTECKNAPYNFEQAVITSFSSSGYHGFTPSYTVIGTYTDTSTSGFSVVVAKYTVSFDRSGNPTYSDASVINSYTGGSFGLFQIIQHTLRKIGNDIYLFYVSKFIDNSSYKLSVIKMTTSGSAVFDTSAEFRFRGTASNGNYFDAAVVGDGSRIDASCQIIVSADMGGWLGITVLNKKQVGECTHKSLGWYNFYLSGSTLAYCMVRPAPGSFTKIRYKMNDSGDIVADHTQTVGIDDQYVGIFCDDSTWAYIAYTYSDSRVAKHSTDDNYVAMASNLYGQAAGNSISGTNNAIVDFSNPDDELDDTFAHLKYLIWPTLVTNQRHHRFMVSGPGIWKGNKTSGTSMMIDNAIKASLHLSGMQSSIAIPTETDAWSNDEDESNSLWVRRFAESDGIYNSQGSRINISNSKFNVLFNYKQGYVSGISYSNGSKDVGTLVSEWDSINDDFYIQSEAYTDGYYWVMWKDCKSNTIKVCHTVNDPFYEMEDYGFIMDIVADRYIIFNTTAYLNCYDIETGKKGHWGSDWNDRILYGVETAQFSDGTLELYSKVYDGDKSTAAAFYKTATVGSGIDVAYQSQKTFTPSKIMPYNSYQRFYSRNAYIIDGSLPIGKIDIFMSQGASAPSYKTSVIGNSRYNGTGTSSWDGALEGTTYPITSSGTALYNMPLVGVKFINSFSGKFAIKIGDTGYSIQYDGIRPVALYNTTSMVDNIEDFFIIQSQYYAVVNDYICAVSYSSSNILNGIEQIVNVNGMQFIGAFPSVAYFYSPSSRSIYAFTGDADLQLFVQTDKITNINCWCYAPNNEWIYLATNNGLYIMTQQNVFRAETAISYLFSNYWKMFSTDKEFNIVESNSGSCRRIAIDKEDDSLYDRNDVYVETAYYGPGDMRQDVIDTWYIKVYKNGIDSGSVEVLSKTLSDIEVRNNKTLSAFLTSDMFDTNGSYLIRYQPENPIGQGQSLQVRSKFPISYIGYSHKVDSTVMPAVNTEETGYIAVKDII